MKIGILGAGGMGSVHARHLSRILGVEILFHDPDPERSATFLARFGAESCTSPESLIAKSDIVDLCLPTDLHEAYALKAIEEGKPTFVEKPLALTVTEGAKIVEAAEKRKVALGVGQVVRYFPEFKAGHELVKAGKIGTPAAARMRRGGGPPGKGTSTWFLDHRRSGGILIDLAIHDFDWLRWTLGEVKFLYSRSLGAKTMAGPDYALTTLTFESGAVAHVESTWMDPSGFRTAYEVCGSGGMIEFDSRSTPTVRTSAEGTMQTEAPFADADDPFFRQLSEFLAAIKVGKEPPVTGRDGLAALCIAEAALHSAQTGKVVHLSS